MVHVRVHLQRSWQPRVECLPAAEAPAVGVAEAEPLQAPEARQPPVVAERHAVPILIVGARHVPGATQGPLCA